MDKPTVAGYYWVRSKFINPEKWIIVECRTETENEYSDMLYPGVYQTGDEAEHFADHYEGWTGPLEPPGLPTDEPLLVCPVCKEPKPSESFAYSSLAEIPIDLATARDRLG